MSRPPRFSRLLATKEIVIVCGPGGVGKTTLAASIAAAAAVEGRQRVLVLTVDPAKRLADALGLSGIGNDATEVAPERFAAAGLAPRGTLFAAMLDVKASWDALVRRYASDEVAAETILSSPLYRDLTARFPGSAEYIAMERLHELHAEGEFDLIVVDTPPGSRSLDLFDAPDRLGEFFSSRLLHWFALPARSRIGGVASRMFSHFAIRIFGRSFLEEIRTLFVLLGEMQEGFVDRARQVSGLLRSEETTFCVVATPEAIPVGEARRLVDALAGRGLHLGLLVANRALPAKFLDASAVARAETLIADQGEPREALRGVAAGAPEVVVRVLERAGRTFADFSSAAVRESEMLRSLFPTSAPVTVEDTMDDRIDLAALTGIGRALLDATAATASSPGGRA